MSGYIYFVNSQRKRLLPDGIKDKIREAFDSVLKNEGVSDDAEITVTFVGDRKIRELNRQFRNIDRSTDVLSFPLGENGVYDKNPATGANMLGDIVISLDHAYSQAELYGHGLEREIAFLTVHSMLHLLGYDHVNGGLEKAIMREKEEKILDDLGLSVNKV